MATDVGTDWMPFCAGKVATRVDPARGVRPQEIVARRVGDQSAASVQSGEIERIGAFDGAVARGVVLRLVVLQIDELPHRSVRDAVQRSVDAGRKRARQREHVTAPDRRDVGHARQRRDELPRVGVDDALTRVGDVQRAARSRIDAEHRRRVEAGIGLSRARDECEYSCEPRDHEQPFHALSFSQKH